jgi:hypothetical protein
MRRDDETTPSDDQQPGQAAEEASAGKAHELETPVVIIRPEEFRIAEVLRHVEAGEIVLIIPENQQRGPPPE